MCLGFKNLYIGILFVGWCQFLFMVILFLTFYLLGIKFLGLTWRIWILFWCWTIFHVWKIPIWSFQVWIFFDWYGLQWLLPVDFQIIHTEVLHSLLFLMLCAFINPDSLFMNNSVYSVVISILQALRLSRICYRYIVSQSYSITWLLLGLIVKKLKLSFLDFRETLLIKIVQFVSVQLDLVMSR